MAKNLFERLQWTMTMSPVLVIGAPDGFDPYRSGLTGDASVKTSLRGKGPYPFILAFARSQAEVAALAPKLVERLAPNDGLLWMAYPKRSSKRISTDITRDQGWAPVGALGFEPVRQVAVDEDWSALRFRRLEKIAGLTRSEKHAISAEGKRRARKAATAQTKTSASGSLAEVFAHLRNVVRPHIEDLPNLREGPAGLSVDSRDTAPSGAPLEFLSIVTRTKSVNLYLMPIYVNPELADDMPAELAKRRQGKSCFNFPCVDEARFSELSVLIAACRRRWAADGRL